MKPLMINGNRSGKLTYETYSLLNRPTFTWHEETAFTKNLEKIIFLYWLPMEVRLPEVSIVTSKGPSYWAKQIARIIKSKWPEILIGMSEITMTCLLLQEDSTENTYYSNWDRSNPSCIIQIPKLAFSTSHRPWPNGSKSKEDKHQQNLNFMTG